MESSPDAEDYEMAAEVQASLVSYKRETASQTKLQVNIKFPRTGFIMERSHRMGTGDIIIV